MIAWIFDTETSGLISNRSLTLDKQPEVIEYYGCLCDLSTGEVTTEIDELVKPQRALPTTPAFGDRKTITEITGITNEMLANSGEFAKIADRVQRETEAAPVVIAHNASFDREIIEIEFERLGRAIAFPRLLCTVEQTIHLKGVRLSLSALHELLFSEKFEGAHRAKHDVQALVRCCVELFKRGIL